MRGVNYQLLATAPAEFCSDDRDVCYTGETMFLKMSNPPLNDLMRVAITMNQQKWLLDGGKPIDTWLKVDTKMSADGHKTYVSNRDAVFNEHPKDTQYGLWVFFNPGLFGGQETLYRGNEGVYFFAFNKEDTIKEAYGVRSSLPIAENFNIDGLTTNLDANSYILSISYGAKTQ